MTKPNEKPANAEDLKGKKGLKRLINATRYSWQGIRAGWVNEAAFREECALAIVMIPIALLLPVTILEKMLLVNSVLFVLFAEITNSAIEAVVDRFVSRNDEVAAKGLKAVLLAVAAGPAPEAMEPLSAQFRAICGYLKWTNAGQVFGLGLAMRPLEETGALDEARKLGASL